MSSKLAPKIKNLTKIYTFEYQSSILVLYLQSVVEPQYCRNQPFERFAFQVVNASEELCAKYPRAEGLGLPEECELPATPRDKEDDCVRILRDEFGGCAERKLLCSKVEEVLGVTANYANVKISRAIEKGLLNYDKTLVSL